jgi:hypothetical protein
MMEAMKKNQEWFLNAAKQAPEGQPIPYDERMGISREDYDEFLKLGKQGTLKEAAALKFDIIDNPDGSHSLDAGPGLPMLKGLKFDAKREVIETPYGTLEGPREVTISGTGGALGPWKGIAYKFTESLDKTGSGKSLSLTLGRQTETGRRFLIYKAMVAENGVHTASFEVVIIYE